MQLVAALNYDYVASEMFGDGFEQATILRTGPDGLTRVIVRSSGENVSRFSCVAPTLEQTRQRARVVPGRRRRLIAEERERIGTQRRVI